MAERNPAGNATDCRIAIVGAGSIGASFAVVHAAAGRPVLIHDADADAIDAAMTRIEATLADLFEYGLIDREPAGVAARIKAARDLEHAVGTAAFVHECVSEDLDLKKKVFKELDELCRPDIVLASNTSSMSISCSESNVLAIAKPTL